MAQIKVNGLTFCYEGSSDNIFEEVSFSIDTDWKLGFIGRNGRGKTTFLNLLLGRYEYRGSITASTAFDYFPYVLPETAYGQDTIEAVEQMEPGYELWKVMRELELLGMEQGLLYRPFGTLSKGEQTRVMLAVLFSNDNHFLLIDEPTNHLDVETREAVSRYLEKKKGFILVSHDRQFLDNCIDHVLVINRSQIVVEKGNFTSWWENKQRQDSYEQSQNEKLKREIGKLESSARRTAGWAEKSESSKIGFDPTKENDRNIGTRAYIGAKTKKMQKQRKNLQKRQERAVEEKRQLLQNVERAESLKLLPLAYHKKVLFEARDVSLSYGEREILTQLNLKMEQGERIAILGCNGAGKSTLLKAILQDKGMGTSGPVQSPIDIRGDLNCPQNLVISYVPQDTAGLVGSLKGFAEKNGLEETVFFTLLRKLDFSRTQLEKRMEFLSEGQKKKVLIARSLCEQAHLYIWDEPLNFIDVFSRMQIEDLLLQYKPSILFIEHDRTFVEKIATRCLQLYPSYYSRLRNAH